MTYWSRWFCLPFNLHFKLSPVETKKLGFLYIPCFGVHCCLPQSVVVALLWRVLLAGVPGPSRQDELIMWSVTPATSSIIRWSLEERVPGVCEHKRSFVPVDGVRAPFSYFYGPLYHCLYSWVSDAIIGEIFQSTTSSETPADKIRHSTATTTVCVCDCKEPKPMPDENTTNSNSVLFHAGSHFDGQSDYFRMALISAGCLTQRDIMELQF